MAPQRPFHLSRRHLKVLAALGRYDRLTHPQLVRLLYAPTSQTKVSELLTELTRNGYATMQKIRTSVNGNPPAIWDLDKLGRLALNREKLPALPVPKHGHVHGDLFLRHVRSVNDALILVELLDRRYENVTLTRMLHDRAMQADPPKLLLPEGKTRRVIPDGWVDLVVDGYQHPLWLEIDKGTEDEPDWVGKITDILTLYQTGGYEAYFGTDLLTVAVVCADSTRHDDADPEEVRATWRRKRCLLLKHWTELALTRLGKRSWGSLFRFTDDDPGKTTDSPFAADPAAFFCEATWFTPYSDELTPLLEGGQG